MISYGLKTYLRSFR